MSEIRNGKVTEEQLAWEPQPGAALWPSDARFSSGPILPHRGRPGKCRRGLAGLPAALGARVRRHTALTFASGMTSDGNLTTPPRRLHIRSSLLFPCILVNSTAPRPSRAGLKSISGTALSGCLHPVGGVLESPREFLKPSG